MSKKTNTVAFALGGLAGNNAFGAGFLQAALDSDVTPLMISCTSGQIRWVQAYLSAYAGLAKNIKTSLYDIFTKELAYVNRTGSINIDVALLGLLGKQNVFRPSYEHIIPDMLRNAADVWNKVIQSGGNVLLMDQLLSLIPGRSLVPDSNDAFFDEVSRSFNAVPIGITFNSYNPKEGVEYVYLNPKARELLHDPGVKSKYSDNRRSEHRPYRFYKEIDAQAVRDALWLYQYGFYEKDSDFVDGAYFRDIMLSELVVADLIFSVRPINHKWLGDMPRTYQGIEDMKTEIGFNGGYSAERDQIMLINKFLAKGYLNPEQGRGFHHVDLVELEIDVQRGYFDYMIESQDVFERGQRMATEKFAGLRGEGKL